MTINQFFEIMKKEKINVSKIDYREILSNAESRLARNINFKGILNRKIDESLVELLYSFLVTCVREKIDTDDKLACEEAALVINKWRETLMNEADMNLPAARFITKQEQIEGEASDHYIHFLRLPNGDWEITLTRRGHLFVQQFEKENTEGNKR